MQKFIYFFEYFYSIPYPNALSRSTQRWSSAFCTISLFVSIHHIHTLTLLMVVIMMGARIQNACFQWQNAWCAHCPTILGTAPVPSSAPIAVQHASGILLALVSKSWNFAEKLGNWQLLNVCPLIMQFANSFWRSSLQ